MQTADRSVRMERAFNRMTDAYPLQPGVKTFTAAGVYDKVGLMVVLAMVTGTISYFTNSVGLMLLGFVAGLVLSLVGIFRPGTAKVVAPLYALAEGLALGGITAIFATGNSGIVPLAVVFTGGIFLAALVIFRSGLVKVTPRFVSMAMMASVGFLLVLVAVWLGVPVPGLGGGSVMVLLGVFGVAIGVMYLFIDFNYVQVGEQRRLPADGEWYGALMLMMSLVFVYINVLRILNGRR